MHEWNNNLIALPIKKVKVGKDVKLGKVKSEYIHKLQNDLFDCIHCSCKPLKIYLWISLYHEALKKLRVIC